MKKMCVKNLIALFLILSCFSFADQIKLSLGDFASVVSKQNHINILISDDINISSSVFYVNDNKKTYAITTGFSQILLKNGFKLYKKQGFYFIDKIKDFSKDLHFFIINLKSQNFKSIKSMLDKYHVSNIYLKNSNSFILHTTNKNFNVFSTIIKNNDKSLPQVKFKINIFYTNVDKMKEKGFDLKSFVSSGSSADAQGSSSSAVYFLNLITMPYNVTTPLPVNSKFGFYAALKFLVNNGYTVINNSPVLTAKSFSSVSFKSVKSIPYLTSTTKTENTTTTTSQSISYKDVGLKVNISPIINGDYVDFKLSLAVEDLVSNSSLTPTVEKKELVSSYRLKKGSLLVLSGVNKETTLKTESGIPFLKDIFLLGNFFKHTTLNKIKSVLSISIEVL